MEDLVQDCFIHFWENKSNFDQLATIKSFLYTSVRNKCLNQIKHENVKQKHEGQIAYELHSEHSFKNHIIEEETFNLLHAEIQNLPDAAKNIMLLALNGLKNPEIAEELNVSVNTVKTQKKIAYAKLKDKLSVTNFSILLTL